MRLFPSCERGLIASGALVLLAGCSDARLPNATIPSDSSQARNESVLSHLSPRTARPVVSHGSKNSGSTSANHVFVSESTGNVVDIFTGTQQTEQLTGFNEPQGLTTDRRGTLYVANTAAGNIEEFAPPYANTPTTIIADESGAPAAVAVSTAGIVAALNICSGTSCSLPGNVAFYAKGKTMLPCDVVYGGVAATPLGGAFDDKGTLFVAALNSGRFPQISEIRGGCKAKTITPLLTTNTLFFPSDIQVDRKDNVAVLDSPAIGVAQIDVYAAPVTHSSKLTLLSMAQLLNAAVPIGFALTPDGKHLWTADGGVSQAQKYAYPTGGSSSLQLSVGGLPEGVAVTPAESP